MAQNRKQTAASTTKRRAADSTGYILSVMEQHNQREATDSTPNAGEAGKTLPPYVPPRHSRKKHIVKQQLAKPPTMEPNQAIRDCQPADPAPARDPAPKPVVPTPPIPAPPPPQPPQPPQPQASVVASGRLGDGAGQALSELTDAKTLPQRRRLQRRKNRKKSMPHPMSFDIDIVDYLSKYPPIFSLDAINARPMPLPSMPGIHGIYMRKLDSRIDLKGCMRCNGWTLVYIGGCFDIDLRIKEHYCNDSGKSSIRRSVAALYWEEMTKAGAEVISHRGKLNRDGELWLSSWFARHVGVVWLQYDGPATEDKVRLKLKLEKIKKQGLERLVLPFNLNRNSNPNHQFRKKIREGRNLMMQSYKPEKKSR